MNRSDTDKTIYIVFAVFALLVLAGFAVVLDRVWSVKHDLDNLSLQVALLSRQEKAENPLERQGKAEEIEEEAETPQGESRTKNNTPANLSTPEGGVAIATAIVFEASSSPALLPRSMVTITVERVVKAPDGIIMVELKAFTKEANSYTAIEPRDFFELVSLEANNEKPFDVRGTFNSIPPKSVASLTVLLRSDPERNSIILQIGVPNNLTFYEFNFVKQTYKEVVIG